MKSTFVILLIFLGIQAKAESISKDEINKYIGHFKCEERNSADKSAAEIDIKSLPNTDLFQVSIQTLSAENHSITGIPTITLKVVNEDTKREKTIIFALVSLTRGYRFGQYVNRPDQYIDLPEVYFVKANLYMGANYVEMAVGKKEYSCRR